MKNLKTGFNSHRLIETDSYHKKEIDFVKVINKELEYNKKFLCQILDGSGKTHYMDEHHEKIVLSVIQWLGTPVGQGFINEVNKM